MESGAATSQGRSCQCFRGVALARAASHLPLMADAKPRKSSPASSATVEGTKLTLLPDGPERLDALIALIAGAQESIRILQDRKCVGWGTVVAVRVNFGGRRIIQ